MANPVIGGEERLKRIAANKGAKANTRQGDGKKTNNKIVVSKKPMAKVKKK